MRAAAALLFTLAACGAGSDTTGLSAWLRIPDATFVAAPLPAPSGGPDVISASVNRTDISPGLQDRALSASLAGATTGVAVGLEGDAGYWILPAGPPDVQEPGALTLATALAFSPLLPQGTFTLVVRPIDALGHAGEGALITLQTLPPRPAPALAFTLRWDTEADLDLHVVAAGGSEIYWDHITAEGGLLDFDSNAQCTIDGRRTEIVSWPTSAPAGHYLARIDTPSLCGQPTAHWTLTATQGEATLGQARGQSIAADTRGGHARGAGLLALEVDMP